MRAKKFHGCQFNRQFPIDNNIVDIICSELNLIIEIDGYSHRFGDKEYKERDKKLNKLGYTTIKFSLKVDLKNIIRVL